MIAIDLHFKPSHLTHDICTVFECSWLWCLNTTLSISNLPDIRFDMGNLGTSKASTNGANTCISIEDSDRTRLRHVQHSPPRSAISAISRDSDGSTSSEGSSDPSPSSETAIGDSSMNREEVLGRSASEELEYLNYTAPMTTSTGVFGRPSAKNITRRSYIRAEFTSVTVQDEALWHIKEMLCRKQAPYSSLPTWCIRYNFKAK